MTLALRVFGVKELQASFGEIPRVVGGSNMRKAMNAGGGVIRDAAAIRVPIGSGLARDSLKVKVRVPDESFNAKHHGRPAYAVVGAARRINGRVAPNSAGQMRRITTRKAIRLSFGGSGYTTRRPSRYFHLLERGSQPHPIVVKNKRILTAVGVVFGRAVPHPGTKAYSPLRKAVQSSGNAAKAAVIAKLKAGLSEWAGKRALRTNTAWGRGVAGLVG